MWRERTLKIVLVRSGIAFLRWHLSPDRLSIASGWLRHRRHHDAQPLCRARRFPAHRGAESIGASQPDRLRCMVKLRRAWQCRYWDSEFLANAQDF